MKIIFSIICFLKCSISIELNLPLDEKDLDKFKVKTHNEFFRSEAEPDDIIYSLTYYESATDNPISRVTYHGVVLFEDNDQHESSFRRVVNYTNYKSKIILAVISNEFVNNLEIGYYIYRDSVYNLLSDQERFQSLMNGTECTIIEEIVKNILKRKEVVQSKIPELDTVDDEPFLVKGNVDISSEKIQEEVDKIYRERDMLQNGT